MKKIIVFTFVFLCLFFPTATLGNNKFIEPSTDFTTNFCNFPYAWSINRGENVKIGVVHSDAEKVGGWISKVSGLASESEVKQIRKGEFLSSKSTLCESHIILLAEPLVKNEYQKGLDTIKNLTEKGAIVIVPAYFGPMRGNYNYDAWRQFIEQASQNNAIIVGTHGRNYQLGDKSFWKGLPVDIYALDARIQGGAYSKPDATIDVNIEDSTYLVTGAAALLKSKTPEISPAQLKEVFRKKGRRVYWMHVDIEYEIEGEKGNERINLSPKLHTESIANDSQYTMIKNQIEKNKKEHPDSYFKVENVIDFECSCFDAALIIGLGLMGDGEWAYQILNIEAAQKIATGKGVTVAILDHMFKKEDESLQNRVVKSGSVLESAPVFDTKEQLGHGTWMARVLAKVAPNVQIMPVRISSNDPGTFTKGIEYAVENGADIISLSHQAIPIEKRPDMDKAIEKASQKGITFVYINYEGKREDVIVPCPIEFANEYNKNKQIFVVGTNFVNESSFPYTWGVSQTAPIVAGVIAMMKEVNPTLGPFEIKKILFESNNIIGSGYPMLDATKALKGLGSK